SGSAPLIANRTAVGLWETFKWVDLGSGRVALQSLANNKYVSAPNGGASPLIAAGASIGTAETFQTNLASPPAPSTGSGLTGQYYDNMDFTNLKLTRTDPTVDFDWGSGSPDASIGADTFSVRWTGQVQAPSSEIYTFTTTSDDGVRLWINGQLVIDNWT